MPEENKHDSDDNCPRCGGTGRCSRCNGSGEIASGGNIFSGGKKETCPQCGGRGNCQACGGSGLRRA
jgi:DnaJ-class molecular chaperone